MKHKAFLYSGFLAPLVFWLTTVLCGLLIEDYNHFKFLVSELGVLGSRTQYLFTIGLLLSAVLSVFFTFGLWKFCKRHHLSILPVLLLSFYFFIAGPALFPMPLKLHGIVGYPFILIMASPIVAVFVWNSKEDFLRLRSVALLSFLIMMLGFLIFIPTILSECFGLKQRFLYAGWTLWSVSLAYKFIRLSEKAIKRA